MEDEALRECVGIVRSTADDLDAVRRDVRLGESSGRRRSLAERDQRNERGGEGAAGQRPRTVRTAKRAVARPWRT